MTVQLHLYSTAHCHLCELAQSLLKELAIESVEIIEIANNDELLEKYGTLIPVLKRLDTHALLNWPFDSGQILQFCLEK